MLMELLVDFGAVCGFTTYDRVVVLQRESQVSSRMRVCLLGVQFGLLRANRRNVLVLTRTSLVGHS
jgi:hypothetical protein